ncbi:MAG: hypothetical protein WBA77_06660 [Microcoleaceae cyanobacterium]
MSTGNEFFSNENGRTNNRLTLEIGNSGFFTNSIQYDSLGFGTEIDTLITDISINITEPTTIISSRLLDVYLAG